LIVTKTATLSVVP